MGFLHLSVELLHVVNKERRWQLVGVISREEGVTSTLWTGEGLVGTTCSSQGKFLDASLTVVVTAWQNL